MSEQVTLTQLIDNILEDGIVDADEVTQLRQSIMADGVCDRDEANELFRLNDAVSGNENSEDYRQFFVSAITDHVIGDTESPGEIDEDEASWLLEKIQGDGQLDKLERSLLTSIKSRATSIAAPLQQYMDDNAI